MTQSEVAILGLLISGDKYGYEIEKKIDQTNLREWTTIGFSSIYNILNKLNKKELIAFRYDEKSDGPKRKVFFILDKGRQVFDDKIIEMIKNPLSNKDDLGVGIVYSGYLDQNVIKEALIKHKETLEQYLNETVKKYFTKFSHKPTVVMLMKRSVMHAETDIKWIDEVLKEYD